MRFRALSQLIFMLPLSGRLIALTPWLELAIPQASKIPSSPALRHSRGSRGIRTRLISSEKGFLIRKTARRWTLLLKDGQKNQRQLPTHGRHHSIPEKRRSGPERKNQTATFSSALEASGKLILSASRLFPLSICQIPKAMKPSPPTARKVMSQKNWVSGPAR